MNNFYLGIIAAAGLTIVLLVWTRGDGMSRLDQVIADITYVRSCLKLLKTIQESGDCNICKKKRTCEYVPKWGEQVRYNCPFFESEVTE